MSLMTEDEAKTKWCPMFRASVAKAMSENPEWATNRDSRYATLGTRSLDCCITTDCMAWKWGKTHVKARDLSEEDRKTAPNNGVAPDDLIMSYRTYGYCGAFGKVEP